MCTILLGKKEVEVFLWQFQLFSEIRHQRELFGIADIIDNQYVVRTKSFFLNSTLKQEIINTVTSISFLTLHQQMKHLGYQNILWLHKVADSIEIKRLILKEIYISCMKKKQLKKPSYKLMSQPSEYLDFLQCNFGGAYLIIQKSNWFYLGILDCATGKYYPELIRTKSQTFETF